MPGQQRDAIVFTGDDRAYFDWLARNGRGYVLNVRRRLTPDYVVLHRSTCRSIERYGGRADAGAFTERGYLKVCSDSIEALARWVAVNIRPDGTFTKACSLCDAPREQVARTR